MPRPKTRTAEELRASAAKRVAAYRKRHPERVKAEIAGRQRRAQRFVYLCKRLGRCCDCGGQFHPVAMDFDHRPGEEKYNRGKKGRRQGVAGLMAAGATLARIKAEIRKCDLICANCHRIRTHQENT